MFLSGYVATIVSVFICVKHAHVALVFTNNSACYFFFIHIHVEFIQPSK
jgi:hypothetical protein